jgi:hypothetical protein
MQEKGIELNLLRFPFAIDCEKVPSHLSKELGNNYENYLNDLTKYSYFVMGNGPV